MKLSKNRNLFAFVSSGFRFIFEMNNFENNLPIFIIVSFFTELLVKLIFAFFRWKHGQQNPLYFFYLIM